MIERKQASIGEVKKGPEQIYLSHLLTRRFIEYMGEPNADLYATQTRIIRRMTSAIAREALHPSEVMERITQERDANSWEKLYRLMFETQGITGEQWIYTPREFVESFRPSAEAVRARLRIWSDKKAAAGAVRIKELAGDQVDAIKRKADELFHSDDFVFGYVKEQIEPVEDIYPEKLQIAALYGSGTVDAREFDGMMRSEPTCIFQTDPLVKNLAQNFPTLGIMFAADIPHPSAMHTVTLAVADQEDEKLLKRSQARKPYSLLSTKGYRDPSVPILDNVVVIDSTMLQSFNHNIFLKDIPYADRISFAQEISPGNFSESGVFVGKFGDYTHLWSLLALPAPSLEIAA